MLPEFGGLRQVFFRGAQSPGIVNKGQRQRRVAGVIELGFRGDFGVGGAFGPLSRKLFQKIPCGKLSNKYAW